METTDTPWSHVWTCKTRQKPPNFLFVCFVFCAAHRINCAVHLVFIFPVKKLPRLWEILGAREGMLAGCSNNKLVPCLRANNLPGTSLQLSHCPPAPQPWEWNLLCSPAWGLIPLRSLNSMIRYLKTGNMKKLHRHRVESISKWAVTAIRKRRNETGNAVKQRERMGEGQESRGDFAVKATCRHTYKRNENKTDKRRLGSQGRKKGKFRAKCNNSWAFSDTQEKKICPELTKIENNSYENRIDMSD